MPFKSDGANVIRRVRGSGDRTLAAARDALDRETRTARALGEKYVPHDTGRLRQTFNIRTETSGGKAIAELSYGEGPPAAPYAAAVERIPPPPQKSGGGRSARHKPPTQWRYTERAMVEHKPAVDRALKEEVPKKAFP